MKEFKGEWCLANQQEIKIPGILTIDEQHSEISLQLFSEKEISKKFNRQFVNGHSGLDRITILNCKANSEEFISSKLYISKYSPRFVFIGCQFNSEEELKFKSVQINLTYLDQWLEVRKGDFFKLEFPNDDTFTAKYNPRKDIIIKLNKECNLAFQRFCLPKGGFNTPLDTDVKHYATFTFEQHQSFDVFLDLTVKLQNLFMLFIGKPLSVKERIGYSEKAIDVNCINHFGIEYYPIEIFNYKILERDIETKFVDFTEMLISTRHFSIEEIKQFILKWFTNYEKFEPVYDIFFHAIAPFWKDGGFTISNVTYNNAFLNIVQALESYHRIKTNNTNADNRVFNSTKDSILKDAKCLSKEQKDFIKNNLVPKGKREFTLKNRIEELIKNKNIFDCLFNNENNVAENLVKWRDSLTHINHFKSTDVQVINLFNKAQIILIVNIFIDLGIEEEIIKQIISSSHLFNK